jgi:aryl-alcohol dehydrogenase-like predicted oxidoreductase
VNADWIAFQTADTDGCRMDYVKLGRAGIEVSRLCLGCMTFGVPERGTHPWTLDEEASRPIVRRAIELGITFFDTANSYSDGTSEEITGRLLREMARRDATRSSSPPRCSSRPASAART